MYGDPLVGGEDGRAMTQDGQLRTTHPGHLGSEFLMNMDVFRFFIYLLSVCLPPFQIERYFCSCPVVIDLVSPDGWSAEQSIHVFFANSLLQRPAWWGGPSQHTAM